MWTAVAALLVRAPILDLPRPVRVEVRYEDSRVRIEMEGEIQDPVRVFAPKALEIWINGEKMTCRRYGGYRLATFPILHNQEACEPY
ncbi:MAG: hypothetical protein SFV18_18760 [Bryobacteraceae bacterium]|nr:hypothetical protein [Bryobacteraceae bacterium]